MDVQFQGWKTNVNVSKKLGDTHLVEARAEGSRTLGSAAPRSHPFVSDLSLNTVAA